MNIGFARSDRKTCQTADQWCMKMKEDLIGRRIEMRSLTHKILSTHEFTMVDNLNRMQIVRTCYHVDVSVIFDRMYSVPFLFLKFCLSSDLAYNLYNL